MPLPVIRQLYPDDAKFVLGLSGLLHAGEVTALVWFAVVYVGLPCLAGLALLWVAEPFDHRRIRRYLQRHGAVLLWIRWTPFGSGWFGTRSERIYAIRYQDAEGQRRRATVKTSVFGGVYFSEDEPLPSSNEGQ